MSTSTLNVGMEWNQLDISKWAKTIGLSLAAIIILLLTLPVTIDLVSYAQANVWINKLARLGFTAWANEEGDVIFSGDITPSDDGTQVDDADHQSGGTYVGMEQTVSNIYICYNAVGGGSGHFYTGKSTWFGVVGRELDANEVWQITQSLKGLLGI